MGVALEPGVGADVREPLRPCHVAERPGEGLDAGGIEGRGHGPAGQVAHRPGARTQAPNEELSADRARAAVRDHPARRPAGAGLGFRPRAELEREIGRRGFHERVPGGGVGAQSLELGIHAPCLRRVWRSSAGSVHEGHLRIRRAASMSRRRPRASRSAPGRSTMRRGAARSTHTAPKPRLCS